MIFNSPFAVNNFQPDLSGFPRFAAISQAIYGVVEAMIE